MAWMWCVDLFNKGDLLIESKWCRGARSAATAQYVCDKCCYWWKVRLKHSLMAPRSSFVHSACPGQQCLFGQDVFIFSLSLHRWGNKGRERWTILATFGWGSGSDGKSRDHTTIRRGLLWLKRYSSVATASLSPVQATSNMFWSYLSVSISS